MSIKLFRMAGDTVVELPSSTFATEKPLQMLVEKHLQVFLGIRLVATEHSTGPRHCGRIDTLGLDENNSPVIIEYKRNVHESVINKGLFYLDWLVDHQGDFRLLVMSRLGQQAADSIDWSSPRLICIASDFTKYDVHAVNQMHRHIELVRYALHGGEHLTLELVNQPNTPAPSRPTRAATAPTVQVDGTSAPVKREVEVTLQKCSAALQQTFASLDEFMQELGDDVVVKPLKLYYAYSRFKNFVCVVPGIQRNTLWLYLKLDPATVTLEPGFSRDASGVGHFGTGDLELAVSTEDDLEKARPLIERAYAEN